MNYVMNFSDVPVEFVNQILTEFQKQSIIIKYVIKKECENAGVEQGDKTKKFEELAQSKINGTPLSIYTVRTLHYDIEKKIYLENAKNAEKS